MTHARKDTLILALWAQVQELLAANAASCPHCHSTLGDDDHRLHAVYDEIELPRLAPIITRVELYAATCHHCAEHFVAPVSNPSIQAVIVEEPLIQTG